MMCSIEGVSRERSSGSFACQLFSNVRSEQIEAALKRMEVARPKRLLKLPIAGTVKILAHFPTAPRPAPCGYSSSSVTSR